MCVRTFAERLALERWTAEHGVREARKMLLERQGELDTGDLFPGDLGVIALPHQGELELVDARWGLTPRWAKPDFGKKSAYNARAETLLEKPTFREPFRKRRCLIPASAFYERAEGRWLRLSPPNGEPFALAGLYEEPNDVSPILTYSMVTTTPNETIANFHDRMPVVLDPEDYAAWLDPAHTAESLRGLLVPSRPEAFAIQDAGPIGRKKTQEETLF